MLVYIDQLNRKRPPGTKPAPDPGRPAGPALCQDEVMLRGNPLSIGYRPIIEEGRFHLLDRVTIQPRTRSRARRRAFLAPDNGPRAVGWMAPILRSLLDYGFLQPCVAS